MSTQAPGPEPELLTPDQRFLVHFAKMNPALAADLVEVLIANPMGGVTVTLRHHFIERFDRAAYRQSITQGLLDTDWRHRTAPGTSVTPAPTPGPSPE